MGMTGEPMADADVAALVDMVLPHFADGPGPSQRTMESGQFIGSCCLRSLRSPVVTDDASSHPIRPFPQRGSGDRWLG
jgi:hypothetical protein